MAGCNILSVILGVTRRIRVFPAHTMFVRFVWFAGKHITMLLVCMMESRYVLYEVGSEFLYATDINFVP